MAKAPKAPKYVYLFGNKKADGDGTMKALLGRQGRQSRRDDPHRPAGAAGLHDHDRSLHLLLRQRQEVSRRRWTSQIDASRGLHWKRKWARSSATSENPLLVSVRSGARDSMPGMMDTILNLGLNDDDRRGPRQGNQQRPLRLGLLSPLRADVRRRGDGRPEAPQNEDTNRSTK